MEARFDDPAETMCTCDTDADCDEEMGERCSADGICEEPPIAAPAGECLNPDCSPGWVTTICPIVEATIQPGPCCGDGIVQSTATYTEECDDGPDGSDTCTPDCERIEDTVSGACCANNGCFENLDSAGCAASRVRLTRA